MDISIVHPSLNKAGGAERYCLEMIQCLLEMGHNVVLYTIDKTDWTRLQETQGIKIEPRYEHYLQEKQLIPDGLFSWLKTAINYTWLLMRGCEESDICINNYGEIMPFFAQVSVVHAVPMGSITENNYGVPFWGWLRNLYLYVCNGLEQYRSEVIITNSRFNAERIKQSGRVEVIHPPVQLPTSSQVEKNGEILTVARLKASKNLNKIAEIAVNSPRNRFIVAGRAEIGSERLIKELRNFKNITVYANPRREDILDLMNQCSLYLSTQQDEAFGMAVVEAMSLGCIPVVNRNGGPWSDILEEKEECGVAYSSTDEAVEKIRDLLLDEEKRRILRDNGAEKARNFSIDVFKACFIDFMNTLEPRPRQDHRLYRWYRKVDSMRKRVEYSIRVPL